MTHNDLVTFSPTLERTTPAELSRQSDMFIHSDMTRLLDLLPGIIFILNKERQTVFGNKAALDHVHATDNSEILGLRLGELVKCRNAGEGCGSSIFCKYCGGASTMLASIRDNAAIEEECHLLAHDGCKLEALDMRVQASPFDFNNEHFTLLVLNDIADEKTKKFLERILFHDILNSAIALAGFSELISEAAAEVEQREYMLQRIAYLSHQIINEINAQRQLMAAEQDELVPRITRVESLDFLKVLVGTYNKEAVHDRKILRIDTDAQSITMTTDEQLLSQVIGSMIKNALEASHPGEAVTIGCALQHGKVLFSVTNPAFIPEQVRAHIFSRSFSTKEHGTGMGTYRMKYLTEKYLHGTVSFITNEQNGTTFTAAYPLEL